MTPKAILDDCRALLERPLGFGGGHSADVDTGEPDAVGDLRGRTRVDEAERDEGENERRQAVENGTPRPPDQGEPSPVGVSGPGPTGGFDADFRAHEGGESTNLAGGQDRGSAAARAPSRRCRRGCPGGPEE